MPYQDPSKREFQSAAFQHVLPLKPKERNEC